MPVPHHMRCNHRIISRHDWMWFCKHVVDHLYQYTHLDLSNIHPHFYTLGGEPVQLRGHGPCSQWSSVNPLRAASALMHYAHLSSWCMNAALGSLLGRTAFMHHADPSGVYQPHRVGMMHECSSGEYSSGLHSCIMTTNRHSALKHYAVLKGLTIIAFRARSPWWDNPQPPTHLVACGLNKLMQFN